MVFVEENDQNNSYVLNLFSLSLYLCMQCHRGVSSDTFFEGILSDPVKVAVVGCGCSVATEPVAEISHRWNISQVRAV